MNVLLVEDERRLARLVARRLEEAGHATSVAFTGAAGMERAGRGDLDVAVVDVMLPGMDGLTLTRRLRERGSKLPILMLTARDSIDERLLGFRAGADDYLVKPFAFRELLARIEALARRTGRNRKLSFGPVEMDVAAHRVTVDGAPVELTPKEFELLEFMLRRIGRVVTRSELKEHVWGFTFDAPTKVVDLYVHYVRRKLEATGASEVIETVRGIGYAIGRRRTHCVNAGKPALPGRPAARPRR
jgi:DNA-binding response OmpR family regulator